MTAEIVRATGFSDDLRRLKINVLGSLLGRCAIPERLGFSLTILQPILG